MAVSFDQALEEGGGWNRPSLLLGDSIIFWGKHCHKVSKGERGDAQFFRGWGILIKTGRGRQQCFTYFLEGVIMLHVQSTNNWCESSNLTYALAFCYSLILIEATLS